MTSARSCLPDADVKLFLTASAAERARRRWLELQAAGITRRWKKFGADIEERDRRDAIAQRVAAAEGR